ncbi:ATP-binding cassette domain-containing protein [Streptomyces sp. BPTC-684]|uniref:ABC-F family ATP-binding cassette domain-containing protein n=1 Tax=Streptomyces sp. BPTC-684 TaxID=3043734 RepID=UPI0024B1AC39|nr:ATP-binding cassette domain-containing protein [Streptomyces sp. BPTC-684]WHM40565.1 ATP-binding cassette domain-containing protein [Streptomyces sp. BPTC-684]
MPVSPAPSVVCTGLSFTWPDGTVALEDLSWAVGPGMTGLIGLNGSGKSTLLRLIAHELPPAAGTVQVTGRTGYLPQDLTLNTTARVDQALGIARTRAALHAIEAGDADERHFAAVGDDWDVEERAHATLAQLGLGHLGLDRTVAEVSGGEAVLLHLAALLLARPDVLLLDEPTNNLDHDARRRLYEAVTAHPGTVIVVSHDRALLERVDRVAELRDGAVRTFGGNLAAYEEALATEQEAALRGVTAARAQVARERRDLVDAQTRQARSTRYGKKMYADNRMDKAAAHTAKRAAQVSRGKQRAVHEQRLAASRERLGEAQRALREDDTIRVDLPATAVPPHRTVLTLRAARLRNGAELGDLEVHGPQRIALTGRNGAGKTTLLRTLTGELPPAAGQAEVHVPLRYLPQRLDLLHGPASVLDNVARLAPHADTNRIRAQLARFLFKGRRADQQVDTLSGGERFRATLAALLLAEPAPQLLLLDEPTNNLDLTSVQQLTQALNAYRGALIVASHDQPFLDLLGITRRLHIDDTPPPNSPAAYGTWA